MSAQINDPGSIEQFVLGGNATFTLVSKSTGSRFTYKVRAPKEDGPAKILFVSVLNGPDNWSNYKYLGTLNPKQRRFYHGKKAKISSDAGSAKAFNWFWKRLIQGSGEIDSMEFWHEGQCAKCGRKLTVPVSIECGFGPVCAEMLGIPMPTSTQMSLANAFSSEPEPGTLAYSAAMFAKSGLMSGEEADAWKDQMNVEKVSRL